MFRRLFFLLLICLFLDAASGIAASGDRLYVTGSSVNVRSGPDTSRSVLMQLGEGHELTEIERRNDWVRVRIAWIGGSGWVHDSLLTSEAPADAAQVRPPSYHQFVQNVEQLNLEILDILDDVFFTRVAYRGEGSVELTATPAWLSAPEANRRRDVEALYGLWTAHHGGDESALVIVNPRGDQVTRYP
ncbi:Uncharacterized conserved protein YgiM, contains N-terminal SH3 domain, DUF1202 family [Geoalkalibacter ferrihydriticus]|uniref:SH3b domain-containing protein n=2 Tax=Geoalkalibacter ferrihydriticus TaxID=392333 RepID=A0A0C2EDQ2_9BACT|nr:SH3 domain-containing protein [Geoalkalibacter ferrihydriticus]KIH76683.1 hypothetical protein GFER_11075 [Geoalkalibacter ferrihydriticus DSM 17813]SDM06512.1 Uncharacterized conserved protein YgiM, contains N-terminal SH3 domain, DUF1202 family [Geoalkalibacter ferrihydriticus]